VKRVTALEPKDDVTPFDDAPTWAVASPASIPHFSAVGYFFVRELQRTHDVPIGLRERPGTSRVRPGPLQPARPAVRAEGG
jgi:hypothetical protein